jgi:hypothetical protein
MFFVWHRAQHHHAGRAVFGSAAEELGDRLVMSERDLGGVAAPHRAGEHRPDRDSKIGNRLPDPRRLRLLPCSGSVDGAIPEIPAVQILQPNR